MSKAEGKRIAIKFNIPLVGDVSGNSAAFTITGQEYQWSNGPNYNGPIVNKTYSVTSVSNHPIEPNCILLELSTGFRNVFGLLTVKYNQALGNLAGAGGAVANFEKTFAPEDLEQGLTGLGAAVGQTEFVQASVVGNVKLLYIERMSVYPQVEYIKATVSGTIALRHISEINP
jgi:hypothetical protein